MTAFLFIPAAAGGKCARKVDLATYASLFAEVEELSAPRNRRELVTRFLAFLLIVVMAVGDMILVARPYVLTQTLATSGAAAATERAVTSL